MRKLLSLLIFAVALVSPALALNKVVSVTATPAVIVSVGNHARTVVVQNPTANTVAIIISIDGTNPTYTTTTNYTGILLAPGQQYIANFPYNGQPPGPIIGMSVTGTVPIVISTDDTNST